MLTQHDIYADGSKNRPPMLNKDKYVPCSSLLLLYTKSKPNEKLFYNSIMNGPYVRRMILNQIILMGLPEDIYAAVDSCKTAQEIWLCIQQKMKGFDIEIQDKKAKNLVVQNVSQNLGVQNVGNQNGLIVVPGIANPNANQIGNGNVVEARNEGDLDEIEEVNGNCILMANLQQAWTSDETLQLAQESRLKIKQFKEIKLENYAKINQHSGVFVSKMAKSPEEFYFSNTSKMATVSKSVSIPNEEFLDEVDESLSKHKALEFEIEGLLRVVVSPDIMSIVQSNYVIDTSNLQTELDRTKEKLENFIVKKEKEYNVLWNNWVPQKVDETNDLSNLITSNSVPIPQESKVMKNNNVIAPGMFRINPSMTSRKDNFVPINKVRASVRTDPITVLQPHVITKKEVISDSNDLSSTGVDNTAKTKRPHPRSNTINDKVPSASKSRVDNTAKTRRPHPRSNTINDRVPSASKSSCIKNKEVEVEEHHKNLLLSNRKNICHLNYVNGMNSCVNNLYANVSKTANQKKHKPKMMKPKKVGSKERLASPMPRKPRTYLRWSLTGRMFDLKRKIIKFSESESQSD
nr:hypothetical protein [Tanacetum cinerariifolium]